MSLPSISILQNIETPFYYYDITLLSRTLQTINEEIHAHLNWHVHYAVKACVNPCLLRMISEAGLGADCVSGGEILTALDAGFRPDQIVFAGVGKTDREIKLALDTGILCFNVESVAELKVIEELASLTGKTARVCFRINPNVVAHTHANITTGLADNKFGIDAQYMEEVIRVASQMSHIQFKGLHFHIGSQIMRMDDFVSLCQKINELQDQLERHQIHSVEMINVGGGLGVNYEDPDNHPIPDFHDYFQVYAKHLQLREHQSLHFELGRSIVAQCGTLFARCIYVKETSHKNFIILDAGMNDLIRPALYGAAHKIQNISSDRPQEVYDVVGPVCESSDVFATSYLVNETRRGDLFALRSAGAYGEVMASRYNCRELPKGYCSDEIA